MMFFGKSIGAVLVTEQVQTVYMIVGSAQCVTGFPPAGNAAQIAVDVIGPNCPDDASEESDLNIGEPIVAPEPGPRYIAANVRSPKKTRYVIALLGAISKIPVLREFMTAGT
jgi:hypothetical protein